MARSAHVIHERGVVCMHKNVMFWVSWVRLPLLLGAAQLSACATLPENRAERQIEAVQEAIDKALLSNDASELARYLALGVQRTGPSGMLTNREEWLLQIESGGIEYHSIERCQTRTTLYPDVAIVTGLVDIEVFKPGTGALVEHNRYTRAYVRNGGAWQLAAHQATTAPAGVSCGNAIAPSKEP